MKAFDINEDLVQHGAKKQKYTAIKRIWKRCSDPFNNAWGWECVSYICSVACMSAVVILLAVSDGKTHAKIPSAVTLNTLIATGCAFSKGLMIVSVSACIGQFKYLTGHLKSSRLIDVETYNAASHSAIGALRLLFKPKALRMSLLGASIIIAALGLGPITQQLVSYPTRSNMLWPRQGFLSILVKLNEWHKSGDDLLHDGFGFDDSTHPSDGHRIRPHASYACISEHCDWPEYVTIGACSECSEITHDLTSQVRVPSDNTFNKTWPRHYSSSLPSGHSLTFDGALEDDMMIWNASVTDFTDAARNSSANPQLLEFSLIYLRQYHPPRRISDMSRPSEDIHYFGSVDEPRAQEPIYDHAWDIFAPNGELQANGAWEAHRCSISLCVQHRKSFVRTGDFIDQVLHQQVVPLNCSYKDEQSEMSWCTMQYGTLLPSLEAKRFLKRLRLPKDKDFPEISGPIQDYSSSSSWMWEQLQSDHGSPRPTDTLLVLERRLSTWRKNLKELFHKPFERINTTNRWTQSNNLRSAWNPYVDLALPVYLDDLAVYVTALMRNGDPSTLEGDATRDETVVQVNWSWLFLPVFLLCSTLILLVSTINETKKAKIKPWKSSTLPLLMDGLDFIETDDYAVEIPELERRAKHTPLGLHKFWRAISSKDKPQGGIIQI